MHQLYSVPELYDIAFSFNPRTEARFYKYLLNKLGTHGVVVEFACGTGRILNVLRGSGFRCVGLDLSPAMASYAHHKNSGLAEIVTADMWLVPFQTGSFSAAVNVLSSISYLVSRGDIVSHLKEASRVLGRQGVYLIDFLLGVPRRRREEWKIQHRKRLYRVSWQVTPTKDGSERFAERIEVRSGSQVFTSEAQTAIIKRNDFETAATRAGFKIEHWFRPFRRKPMLHKPISGRVIAALRKTD